MVPGVGSVMQCTIQYRGQKTPQCQLEEKIWHPVLELVMSDLRIPLREASAIERSTVIVTLSHAPKQDLHDAMVYTACLQEFI